MDELALIADLYRGTPRQGPGGEAQTALALTLSGLASRGALNVADIGCGTGASTLQLAASLDAHITAIDFLQPFLDALVSAVRDRGLSDRVTPLACDMASLPFEQDSLDLIWSEGAIYNIGFERGVHKWREFLKLGGVLAVSEITWLTGERPAAVEQFWTAAYPQIDTAAARLGVLEACGFTPLGYFCLPETCWQDNFYRPLAAGFDDFLARHRNSASAQALVDEHRKEMALYETYRDYYSYGFYIARRSSWCGAPLTLINR
jgi:SAM-dependent methyltransferase